MDTKLSENIRIFRKQRSLTQEQLAEVLGVTVGAVYKWEAKLSVPELSLIMEMADFFDTSVDVLLGYEMKDNRLAVTVRRLKEYRQNKDYGGLTEAEKALKKYPNSFDIVYNSAVLYNVFGLESQDKTLLYRALELLEYARLLLSQNTDPEIGELTIYANMAEANLALGEGNRAVEILKQHNEAGIYNGLIGLTLASDCKRPEEAIPFLEEALLKSITTFIHIVTGYVNVFCNRKDYCSAQDILLWGIDVLSGLKKDGKSNFLDKVTSVFFVCLAYSQIKTEDQNAAYRSLHQAKELAEQFDASPVYEVNSVKFVTKGEGVSVHDNIGITATDGIQKTIGSFADETLSALWKEMTEHED